MNVLVVGKGGREHAIAWALEKSCLVKNIYAAPGNPGIESLGQCVPIDAEDINGLTKFAQDKNIDLVFVGPDGSLEAGVVDAIENIGIRAFGPTRAAAEIEWSKAFAKQMMLEDNIPTADFSVFTDVSKARNYIKERGAPIVIKVDGLAGGKGALVCNTLDEALHALEDIMTAKLYGKAGSKVVIEDFMRGEEASIFALTDGKNWVTLLPSQDHKAINEGDTGPNTGGMGAYAPAPIINEEMLAEIATRIIEPTITGMRKRGRIYRGVLYCGIMITADGPKVVEFNSRFGDPEAQVILPLLENDLMKLALSVSEGKLCSKALSWKNKTATCVVMASQGYPGSYQKGQNISGLDFLNTMDDVFAFHADTALKDGQLITNGGRILGITALAEDLQSSISRAYHAVEYVKFDNQYFRRDIGAKGL